MEKWIQMAPRVDSDRHRDVLLTLPFMVRLAVGGDQKVRVHVWARMCRCAHAHVCSVLGKQGL